jgi:hypothetical protein
MTSRPTKCNGINEPVHMHYIRCVELSSTLVHGGTKLFAHLLFPSAMRDGIGQDVAASDILETAS